MMLTLAVTGFDADPNAVTEALGFGPTKIGRKGEPSPSGKPQTFNGWWHEVEGQPLVDGKRHDDAMSRILSLLQGREDRFANLWKSIQPQQVTIYGGLYVPSDGQCGIWLEPEQMQLLAACGVGWGLDLSSLPANVRVPLVQRETGLAVLHQQSTFNPELKTTEPEHRCPGSHHRCAWVARRGS